MALYEHKRGATLSLTVDYAVSSVGQNLTGYTVTSQVRKGNSAQTLLATLTVTLANQGTNPGRVTLSCADSVTATWAPGDYKCDVRYASGAGAVAITETFDFRVLENVTQ